VVGQNAATDAELDVAVGLMEAYKQWGDEKYLTDAKAFIAKIWKNEVDSGGLLSPGDSWGVFSSQRNPSYFSTAALDLFKKVDSSNWNRVLTNSYGLLMKSRNATTGLVPDWCSNSGQAQQPVFKYDAVRTPWRMSWAYCWNGNDTAKAVSSSIASWITTKTGGDPAKIGDGYNLDGTQTSQYNNGTFVGCFATAGLVDAKHQAWLDASYGRLSDTLVAVKEKYYSQSLKLLTLLLLSGNMPDFWNMPTTAVSPAPAAGSGKMSAVPAVSLDLRGAVVSVSNAVGACALDVYNSAGRRIAGPLFGYSDGSRVNFPLSKPLLPGAYRLRLKTEGNVVNRLVIAR
jgi:endo-1,4-beta-D-glucanase Y